MASVEQLKEPVVTEFAPRDEFHRPSSHAQTWVPLLERAADLVAIVTATSLAYYTYTFLQVGKRVHYSSGYVLAAGLLFALTFVTLLDHGGAYQAANSLLRIRETERVLRVCTQTFALAFFVTFFLPHSLSRWVVVLSTLFVPLLLVAEKQIFVELIRYLHTRGYGLQNVLVYGAGSTGRRVFSALVSSPKMGLNPVAIIDDNPQLAGKRIYEYGYRHEKSAPIIAGPLSPALIEHWGVNLVIMGIPSLSKERMKQAAQAALSCGANVAFVPQLSVDTEAQTDYVILDGVLIASFAPGARKRLYEAVKRCFDFSAALVLLLLSVPVWAMVALLIRIDSKGPVFFHQTRVGARGKHFKLYKFRSMHANVPKFGFHPTTSDDPRVTRFGKWLRRTSLDEVPQLINVLRGDMSLVGPRPEMPFIVERYTPQHRQRLEVTPGLTGLWQLSADRRFLIHENIQYDLYYIRHRNFFMDMAILLHTAVFAMRGM